MSGIGRTALASSSNAIDLDAELALAGRHHRALDADPVAEVELAERGEGVVADDRLGDEQLHLAAAVDASWRRSACPASRLQHHPPGDGHALLGLGARLAARRTRRAARPRVCVRSKRYGYGLVPGVAERLHLVEPLGLLGRQPTADQVWFDVGFFGGSQGQDRIASAVPTASRFGLDGRFPERMRSARLIRTVAAAGRAPR